MVLASLEFLRRRLGLISKLAGEIEEFYCAVVLHRQRRDGLPSRTEEYRCGRLGGHPSHSWPKGKLSTSDEDAMLFRLFGAECSQNCTIDGVLVTVIKLDFVTCRHLL